MFGTIEHGPREPLTKPPAWLESLVRKIGGTSPNGLPMYRIVRIEERLIVSSGVWVDWDKDLNVSARTRTKGAKPWRTVVGTRQIKKYGPAHGWVLEKWCPPQAFGSREQWYKPMALGGTMLFVTFGGRFEYVPSIGGYPEDGDYESTGYIFQSDELTERNVITCLQAIRQGYEDLPRDPLMRARRSALRAFDEAQKAEIMADKKAMDIIEDAMAAFYGAPMSGFGEKRPHSSKKIQERLRIRSHGTD